MADIQLEALTDVIFKPSKQSSQNFEKLVAALLERADIPRRVDIPVDPNFQLKSRAEALRQIDKLYKGLEDTLGSKAVSANSAAAEGILRQQELLEKLAQTLKTVSALSRRARSAGSDYIEGILAGTTNFSKIPAERQQDVRRVLAEREIQAQRIQSIVTQASSLASIKRGFSKEEEESEVSRRPSDLAGAFDIPALKELQKNIQKENSQLKRLTDIEYLQEQARKESLATEKQVSQFWSQRVKEAKAESAQERRLQSEREKKVSQFWSQRLTEAKAEAAQERKAASERRKAEAERKRAAKQEAAERKRNEAARRKALKNRVKAQQKEVEDARQASIDEGRLREGRLTLIRAANQGVGLDRLGSQRQIDVARFALEDERRRIQQRFAERDAGIRSPLLAARDEARLNEVVSQINKLKTAQRDLGKAARETAEDIDKETAADRRRQKQLEKDNRDAVEVARVRAGQTILDQFGGPSAVHSIPREKLPLAAEAIKAQVEELGRQRDALLRNGQSVDHLDGEYRKLNDSLREAKARMRGVGSAVKEFGLLTSQFLRLGVGFGVIFEVINGVRALITQLIDLDSQMKNIQAVSQATSAEMIQVGGAIQRTALATKFSVTEIAQAALVLSQAGVKPSELTSVLSSVANFASATQASIETAADLVSSMRNVFKELDDLTISNQLTQAVNISKTSAEDLKSIVSLGAQTASRFNLTGSQFLAAAATLRNAGIQASTVGTGLRRSLLEVFAPSNKVVNALKKRYKAIGEELTSTVIRNRFFSFSQDKNPLVQVLKELKRLGFESGEGKVDFQNVFEIRTQNALSALVANLDQLQQNQAAIPFSNAAANAARTQMESLANSAENLGGAIVTMTNSIAGGAIPALEHMADTLTNVIEKITNLNDRLVAETGVGLGSFIAGGALSGVATFATSKGGIVRRLGKGLLGGVAGGAAGAAIQSDDSSTGVNQAKALLTGVIGSTILSAVIDQVISRMGGGSGASIPGRVTGQFKGAAGVSKFGAASIAEGAEIVSGVSAIGSVAGGIKTFFSRIGEAASGILSKLPWLRSVASVVTRINPLVAGITALVTIVGLGSRFFGDSKLEDAKRKYEQSLKNFDKRLADFQEQSEQLDQFRLSDTGLGAKQGTAASVLESLESEQKKFNDDLQNFFGGTVENVAEVRQVLGRLAHEGAVAKSHAQKDLIAELAKIAKIRDAQGEEVSLSEDNLLARGNSLSELANTSAEISNQTKSLQDQLVRLVKQLEDAGEDISPAQQRIVDFVNQSSGATYRFLTGQQSLPPEQAQEIVRRVFEAATEAGEASLKEARLDQGEAAKFVDRIFDANSKTEITNAYSELANRAQDVGVSASDLLKQADDELSKKRAELTKENNSASSTFGRIIDRFFLGKTPENPGLTLDQENRLQAAHDAAQARVDQERADREANNARVRKEAELIQQTIRQALQEPQFQKLLNSAETSAADRERIQKAASDQLNPRGLLIDQDAAGSLNLSASAKTASKFVEAYTETMQRAIEASEKIYIPDAGRQKRLIELDAELEKIKRENVGFEAQKRVLNEKTALQLQEINAQIAHQNKLREDVDKPEELANINKELQNLRIQRIRIESQHNQALAQLNKQEVDQRRSIARELLEAQKTQLDRRFQTLSGRTDTTLDDFRKLDEERKANLEKLLANEEAKLKAEGATNDQIKVRIDELKYQNRSLFVQSGMIDQITQSLQGVKAAQASQPTPTVNTIEGARQQELGRGFSKAERQAALISDIAAKKQGLEDVQDRMTQLAIQGKTFTDEFESLKKQAEGFEVAIGTATADLENLNNGPLDQIAQGLDLKSLSNGLDGANNTVENLADNIRTNLVTSIDSIGSSFLKALRDGKTFGQGIISVIASVGQKLLDTIADTAVNSLTSSLFKTLSGAADSASQTRQGGGGIGASAGSFFGSLFSSAKGSVGLSSVGDPSSGQFVGPPSPAAQASSPGFLANLTNIFKSTFAPKGEGFLANLTNIFKSAFSSFGSFLSGLFGGGASGAIGGGSAGSLAQIGLSLFARKGASDLRKYASGGIIKGPGTGTSDSISGVIVDSKTGRPTSGIRVSNNEAILNAKAVNFLGRGFIDSVNQGKIMHRAVGGFLGPVVSPSSVSAGGSKTGAQSPGSSSGSKESGGSGRGGIRVINVVDPSLVQDYLTSSSGERTIINTIQRNSGAIKQVLR